MTGFEARICEKASGFHVTVTYEGGGLTCPTADLDEAMGLIADTYELRCAPRSLEADLAQAEVEGLRKLVGMQAEAIGNLTALLDLLQRRDDGETW